MMTKYFRKPGEVEANQFFYGRPMIPGVVYPADRSEGSPGKRAYIFIDENDNTQTLVPGDWVVMEDDDEGNTQYYVIKPEIFDLLFTNEEGFDNEIEVEQDISDIWHSEPYGELRLALAAYAHQAWSQWMRYMFDKGETRQININGGISTYWLMPSDLYHRWQRQMKTPYADLPDEQKVSDLAEADKITDVIQRASKSK